MRRPYGIHAPNVLDDLYKQLEGLLRRRTGALATMVDANMNGNDDAYDGAAALHDECSDEITAINSCIEELEDVCARAGY